MGAQKSVVIVDDHQLVVDGLRMHFQAAGDFSVVGSAATAEEALQVIRATLPDFVIIDLSLRGNRNGLTLIRELREYYTDLVIIALSFKDDPLTVNTARQVGANGFISKNHSNDHLIETIRVIVGGGTAFPETGLGLDISGLSAREVEALSYFSRGFSAESIADRMGVNRATVRTYLWRIQKKLGVDSLKSLRDRMATASEMEQ